MCGSLTHPPGLKDGLWSVHNAQCNFLAHGAGSEFCIIHHHHIDVNCSLEETRVFSFRGAHKFSWKSDRNKAVSYVMRKWCIYIKKSWTLSSFILWMEKHPMSGMIFVLYRYLCQTRWYFSAWKFICWKIILELILFSITIQSYDQDFNGV